MFIQIELFGKTIKFILLAIGMLIIVKINHQNC